jgi:hypothetical protein
MATTSNTYTGNGSNKLFSITFPYLETSDIDVYLNGTLQTIITQYTFANATTVEFVAAPANGAVILLDRSTDDANPSSCYVLSWFIHQSSLILMIDLPHHHDPPALLAGDVVEVHCVIRTVDSKLKDTVLSVKDFGAVGDGTTNDYAAIQAAVNAAGASGTLYFPKGVYSTFDIANGATTNFIGDRASFTGGWVEKIPQLGSISGDGSRQYDALGGAIRCTAGVFGFINDTFHRPTGLSSVTQPDAYTIRVNYNYTTSKITHFTVAADDALAPYGVVTGSDVGTSYANIKTSAPLSFYCNGSGSATSTPLFQGSVTGAVASNVLTITHPPVADIADAVVVTPANGPQVRNVSVGWSTTTVEIRVIDDLNGYVYYDGSAWVWASSLSNNVTGPTFTWTAGNTLQVTHADAGDSWNISLTPHQPGAINPVVDDISSTYFGVAFYNASGTQLTSPTTGMKFWYRRNFLVHCKMPATPLFSVRRGYASVPVANYSNVAGNNFWISGLMERNT